MYALYVGRIASNFFNKMHLYIFSGFIFAKNYLQMETAKKSKGKYWILFLISIAAFFGVYAVGGGYCSLILPFNVTFFAMALDLI